MGPASRVQTCPLDHGRRVIPRLFWRKKKDMPSETLQAASGQITSRRGYISIPATPLPASGTASFTAAFVGAELGDQVGVSPNAPLGATAVLSFARVSAGNVIEIHLANLGAALTVGTQSNCAVVVNHI